MGDKVSVSVEYLPAGFSSAKLFPRWKGPYKIIKLSRDSKVLYLEDYLGVSLKHPVSVLRVKRWNDREMELCDSPKEETETEKDPNSSIPEIIEHSEELPSRLENERLGEDVQTKEINNNKEPNLISSKKKKGKDWSFVDTDEFRNALNQNVEFIGRTPRSAKANYTKEHILWLDF